MLHKKVDEQQLQNFLLMVRSIENNDFADRATDACRFIHSTIGITTEVVELKQLVDSIGWHECTDEEFSVKFKDEIGDIVFYLLQGMDIFGWNYTQIKRRGRPISAKDNVDGLIYVVGEINDILKKNLSYNVKIDEDKLSGCYALIWIFLLDIIEEFETNMKSCINVTIAKLNYRFSTGNFRYIDRANRNREEEQKVMLEAANE
jgi:hypothetical protein